jgi:hypothetical protein
MRPAQHKRIVTGIVHRHAALGIEAKACEGSGLEIHACGPDAAPLAALVGRARGGGLATIEGWLADADALVLHRDKAEPIIVLPWRSWARLVAR